MRCVNERKRIGRLTRTGFRSYDGLTSRRICCMVSLHFHATVRNDRRVEVSGGEFVRGLNPSIFQRTRVGLSSAVRRTAEVLRRAGQGVWRAFRWVYRSTRRQAKINAAKVEIRRLQSRQLDAYAEMGRVVYRMYGEDRVRTASLRQLCQQVQQWENDIAALEAVIVRLQIEGDTDGRGEANGLAPPHVNHR